jgi:hypothetical protein
MPKIIFSVGSPILCGGLICPCQYAKELKKRGINAIVLAEYHNPVLEAISGEFCIDRGILDSLTDEDVLIAVRWEQCERLSKYKGRKIQLVQGNDRYYYETNHDSNLQAMLDARNNKNWELIGVSQYCLQDFNRGVVIHNGIDDRFRVNHGLERDIDALVEGNSEPLKNIPYAIEQAKKDGHKKIVWLGRETQPTSGVECITNPPQEEIPKIYQRAKHFYKYSKSEGFCLPIWEALLSGCEIHTWDMGCNSEFIYTKEEAEKLTWELSTDKLLEYLGMPLTDNQ